MKKLSKRTWAWIIILVVVAAGVVLNNIKGKDSVSSASSMVKKPVKVLTGRKFYKQRYVTGDEAAPDKVAIINIVGEISNSRYGPSYRRGMVDELIDQMKEAEKDNSIKAVLLDINSPGGPIIDADLVYEKIKKLAEKKTVVAYLDRTAASGGYYIACAAKKIVSHPLTLTGNIGVIMDYMNLSNLLGKKLGVEMGVIKSGRYKDIGSPYRSMDVSERKMLQGLVDEAHSRFVQVVSAGRNIPESKLANIADGRIFSGAQAKKAGLVDELGSQEDAIEITKNLCGLKKAQVIEYYTTPKLRDWLLGKFEDTKIKGTFSSLPEPALKYLWMPSVER
ncbi:signal peptide peptidase SppA [Candidatus Desantisbacteria bacterium CG_4_10_14_0_8_um_filter_48_22]|uniref:Signal peptide peptidase SppA n=1 Tax=Candidatus Desantisbacteria bacterium CG_4_10_14_0_8_um_filter_48_22 TaxID=1974543 RepID=A0A2M7SA46_9BACT|nr:MAG: hypothetical protein AUJ67_03595 [Candidatus Desantisbacteria bacterium CG1_02_49_89]PIV54460.1 MAG: signal peptide peptidase SppA [Candidatus Desantisbacteria bacterium CG02_land_8_20_14_3_00_49_13]PIZ16406.1 MAG: signal peptide peptidase SppA [Candidatus Desantisbacteria bacterium CG_4_10_14_0_8_um_filter_48_22]